MLRRYFLKITGISIGALFAIGKIPLLTEESGKDLKRPARKKYLHLSGDVRSGCATPPEMALMFENGIHNLPG